MSPLRAERVDGVPIVHVTEDIDAANAAVVERQLGEALTADAARLVVDLSATRYLDSAGIDMLLRLSVRLEHRRGELVLVVPEDSHLRRLFSLVGLPDAIAVHPTVAAALRRDVEQRPQSMADRAR